MFHQLVLADPKYFHFSNPISNVMRNLILKTTARHSERSEEPPPSLNNDYQLQLSIINFQPSITHSIGENPYNPFHLCSHLMRPFSNNQISNAMRNLRYKTTTARHSERSEEPLPSKKPISLFNYPFNP